MDKHSSLIFHIASDEEKNRFITLKLGTSSTTTITITTHQVRHDTHQNGIQQNDTQHNNKKTLHLERTTLEVNGSTDECRHMGKYAECRYATCRGACNNYKYFCNRVNLIKCFGVNLLSLFVEPYLFRAFEGGNLLVVK